MPRVFYTKPGRGKLHYNADRWFAYCADRMGWQVGQWINGTKADAVATEALHGDVVAPGQPEAHLPPGTDAASSSTPSVFRTRHQRGGETVNTDE